MLTIGLTVATMKTGSADDAKQALTGSKVIAGVRRRVRERTIRALDHLRGVAITIRDAWPCLKEQVLVVGSESSGTTIVSKLLLSGGTGRFLKESYERWVWKAYMSIYPGEKQIKDYPRLQLFDFIKVPGFASILETYHQSFPNAKIVYVVRDPRDVVASAFRTFKLTSREQLKDISWVTQDWLKIKSADPVERLANRWSIYLRESAKVESVIYLRYEDFCRDKVGTAKRLAQLMSLPFNESYAREIADQQASHHTTRDYRPVGPSGWKNSPCVTSDDEAKIKNICQQQMSRWGYL